MNDPPQIFAFYSFKGGVGRSMAVLNLAFALAGKGRHVLVLDMDLEAPGISGFLHREREIAGFARRDMVDLVRQAFFAPLPFDPLALPPVTEYVVPILSEKLHRTPHPFSELGRLDIIPVDEGRDYYERLTSLGLGSYSQDDLVRAGSVLRAWLKRLRFPIDVPDYYGPNCDRTAGYDYVLVDSRTGITETGGLCIGPLSDQLVVLTALNDQNVEGTRRFLTEVGILDSGPAPKPYTIVASLVPTGEIEKKRDRLREIEASLGRPAVKLSYHPQLALRETIFTRDHPDEYLTREYEELSQHVLRMANDWCDDKQLSSALGQPRTSPEFRNALHSLLRVAWIPGIAQLLSNFLSSINFADLSDDTDYILWDRLARALCAGEASFRVVVVNNWANLMSEWARISADPELAELRMNAAFHLYAQIIESDSVVGEQKGLAFHNRGVRYAQRGQLEKSIADYDAVVLVAGTTSALKAHTLISRGIALRDKNEPDRAIADFNAVIDLEGAPPDQKAAGRLNRAVIYAQLGRPDLASVDYAAAIQASEASVEQSALPTVAYPVDYLYAAQARTGYLHFAPQNQTPIARSDQHKHKSLALLGHGLSLKQLAQHEKAVASFTAVIDMPGAPTEHQVAALLSRGLGYNQLGVHQKAVEDLTEVIRRTSSTDPQRSFALLGCGLANEALGETNKAIEDYTTLLAEPAAAPSARADALCSRGLLHYSQGKNDLAIADLKAAAEMPDLTIGSRVSGFFFLGLAYAARQRFGEAISAFTAATDVPNIDVADKARALLNRGMASVALGDLDKAIADYTAVEKTEGIPDERVAEAVYLRGLAHARRGDRLSAILDFTTVVEFQHISVELKTRAILSRGSTHGQQGNLETAIADSTRVIQIPNSPPDAKVGALFIRGLAYSQKGALEMSIADLSAVIATNELGAQQKAAAFGGRGWAYFLSGDYDRAIEDERRAVELKPREWPAQANLAIALLAKGETDDALLAYDDALALSTVGHADEMLRDLRKLTGTKGAVPGSDAAIARIEARKEILRAPHSGD
jgi:tetratricopeptide (TPR) repeat protein